MKLYKLLGITVLLFIFTQCRHKDIEADGNTAIRSNLVIRLIEQLENGTRKLYLSGSTKTIYPCANYSIKTAFVTSKGGFKINYKEIIAPTICLTSFGAASSGIELGTLSNGNYDLQLNGPNWVNKGTLKVTTTEFELIFSDIKGIEIPTRILKRVPPNTYWGTIGYHKINSLAKVDSLVDKMKQNGAIFQKQAPGDYRYYQIDSNGNIMDPELSGYYFVRSIIFQLDGNEDRIRGLIRTDGIAEKDNLSISIYNDKGERIDNWSK